MKDLGDTAFWNEQLMAYAIDMVEPAIMELMGDTDKQTVCVEVLGYESQPVYTQTIGFDQKEHWVHPYDQLAHGKAELSFRTGMDTSVVISEYPELLMPDDPRYPGGVCYDRTIVVGVSGLAGYFDEGGRDLDRERHQGALQGQNEARHGDTRRHHFAARGLLLD